MFHAVFVCVDIRPMSEDEMKARIMISCDESKQQVIATQNTANKLTERVFVFDKVCFLLIDAII